MDFFDKYYKDEKTLLQLIKDYEETLDRVEYIGNLFKNKVINNPVEMYEILLELGGIFTSLNSVALSLDAEKLNREQTLAETKRTDKQNEVEGYYQDRVQFICYLRKIRNIFFDRCESSAKIISIIQSHIKSFDKEKFISND